MSDKHRFTTRSRSITSDGELTWGDDEHTWEGEADTAEGVSFEDGVARVGPGVPDGGVARYPLAGDATDVWGDNDGTVGGVSFVDDPEMGTVAEFDGSADITLPPLGFSGDASVSVALRHLVDTDAPDANNFFGFGTDGQASTTYSIRTRGDGSYRYYFWSNDLDVNVGSYYGTWSSVVVTYDAPGSDRRLYHDGGLVDADTPDTPSFADENYSIGGFNDEFVSGRISNVQVFDRPLTATEASTYHDTGHVDS